MSISFYGGGGHFKVAYNIAILNGYMVEGVYDEKPVKYKDVPYLGNLKTMIDFFDTSQYYFCSIGSNKIREKIASHKFDWINLVHPSAIIAPNTVLGKGNIICAGVVIEPDCKIGDHCIINTNSSINHDCIISDFVHVAPGSTLCGNVTVGKSTLIGAGTSIIPKINIGENCTIGAGSTVVRNIESNVTAFGNPCKQR